MLRNSADKNGLMHSILNPFLVSGIVISTNQCAVIEFAYPLEVGTETV